MPVFQLTLSMFIWGTLGYFVLKTELSALNIAFFRCLIGGAILAPYCWYKGMFQYRLTLTNTLPVLFGGVFVVLNWVLLFLSFQYASITLGNVSYYVQPIFLLILGYIFFQEQIEPLKWIFIVLTVLGVYLTVDISDAATSSFQRSQLLGVGCALFAGLLYSFATVIVKKYRGMPTPLMSFIQFIGGGVLLLPFVSFQHIQLTSQLTIYLLIIGVIHTALAFVLYYDSVSKLSTVIIAIASYIDPIVAVITDVIFFEKQLSTVQLVGIFFTLLGSYCAIQMKGMEYGLRGKTSKLIKH